jgi:predicted O-methyltransferase YrrM
MTDYQFTQDWFHWAPKVWDQFIPMLPARKRFLELGAYEGRSTVWITEHMLEDDGVLLSVDTWEGAEEHVAAADDMAAVEHRYDYNHSLLRVRYPDREVVKIKSTSYKALTELSQGPQFDFIYIDASHTAPDVLTDACIAFPMLKDNGVMVFDDYLWGAQRDILHRPKLAIDAFANIFAEHFKPVHIGYQYIIRKEK